jgi:signal transduction histidine kinase
MLYLSSMLYHVSVIIIFLLSGRPCDLCDVLKDLVSGALPLAYKQQRTLDITGISNPLHVAVEESALRQAFSNLIEGALLRTQHGGRVQIYAGEAPAGGTLVVIDDDGPDMQYMVREDTNRRPCDL